MYAVIIGLNDFPDNDAGAVRDLAFAKIYQQLGYDVIVISQGRQKNIYKYKGICCYSIFEERKTIWAHFSFYFGLKKKVAKILDNIVCERKGSPAIIHFSELPFNCINMLLRMGELKNTTLIHDSKEWYSPCEFKRGRWDKSYIANDLLNCFIIRKPVRVIAISSFLYNHFQSKGLRTTKIPVIMDKYEFEHTEQNDKIRIMYAGNMGGKDEIIQLLSAVDVLSDEERSKFQIDIYGINEEMLKKRTGISRIPKEVNVYGRVSREEVQKALIRTDFSFLLRPEKERYAQAGFPTKAVEAMMHGTAMLCNFSSDLKSYLNDGVNAVIIRDNTDVSVGIALRKILALKRNEIEQIKREAKKTAETEFCYERYIQQVRDLIEV